MILTFEIRDTERSGRRRPMKMQKEHTKETEHMNETTDDNLRGPAFCFAIYPSASGIPLFSFISV
jgi:hypothetical protein